MLRSVTALLGSPVCVTLPGDLIRLVAFLLFLGSSFLDGFFRLFDLLCIRFLSFFRCLFSYSGFVSGSAPGARFACAAASSAMGGPAWRSNRNSRHQSGDTETCHETFDLVLVHSLTTFQD
jgi:hypothetical protein